MKFWIGIFFIFFIVFPTFGQDLLYNTSSRYVDFSLSKQSVIHGEIRGSAYTNSGSIFLFFRIELLSKNDTVTVNASVKKVILESTISNQIRIYSSEKQEGLTSEMTGYIKKILESPISMDISAINGEIISIDTSKAVRFLTNIPWENFFVDFSSSIFYFTSAKLSGKRAVISKKSEGVSEKLHYLLDSAAGGNNYFSFSGDRKTNAKKLIAGTTVLSKSDFTLSGTMAVNTTTHLVLSKKTVYSGKGNYSFQEVKMPFEINEIIESKIDFRLE